MKRRRFTLRLVTSVFSVFSSPASDKPALAERTLEVIKGYIYIPEKGEMNATDHVNTFAVVENPACNFVSFSVPFSSKAGGLSFCHLCGHLSCKFSLKSQN